MAVNCDDARGERGREDSDRKQRIHAEREREVTSRNTARGEISHISRREASGRNLIGELVCVID